MSFLGIKAPYLEIIQKLLPADILSLSYPDLVMPVEEVERITGVRVTQFSDANTWHKRPYQFAETLDVFKQLGSTLRCVDIVASRGVEEVFDLNHQCDLGKYDVVLDCGTTEHCFNIAQAMLNAANAVKEGGFIIHTPPTTMLNHGFYNLNPTLFHDFYKQNGWELHLLIGENQNKWLEVPAVGRSALPPETSLCVVAQRKNSNPLKYPVQNKYLHNPNLK